MDDLPIPDPRFRAALDALEAGDRAALERLLAADPDLVRDRLEAGEGYFHRPYLLWFVAENPIRAGRLPANIVELARTILEAIGRHAPDLLRDQATYTLGLVSSGRVARECGVQIPLIDLLSAAGAELDGAVLPALAHHETAAVERLLENGADLTLAAALCTGREDEAPRLAATANAGERQIALTAAACYGDAPALAFLLSLDVDLAAFSPEGFHSHGTPLHQAVAAGSLEAVKVLAEGGAPLDVKDRIHDGTPLEWAEYLEHPEIAAYLKSRASGSVGA